MFCGKCGNSVADDEQFCSNCGNKIIRNVEAFVPKNEETKNIESEPTIVKTKKPVKAKKSKLKFALIPITIILALQVVVVVMLSNDKNSQTDKKKEASNGKNPKSSVSEVADTNPEADNDFLFGDIVKKCPECEASLYTLLDIQEQINSFGYSESQVKETTLRKYNEMHHDCKADIIYVENYPYTYRCAFGYYTGQWQGAGPQGEGSFIGNEPLTGRLITYDGEWRYGLPEGTGELFLGDFGKGDLSQTYAGEMHAGLREGSGVLYEAQVPIANYYSPEYTLYEETMWTNDVIAQETYCETYDMTTNEMKAHYIVRGDTENYTDVKIVLQTWRAGELSPSEREVVEKVIIASSVVLCAHIIKESYESSKQWKAQYAQEREAANARMFAEIDRYNEQKAADDKAVQDAIDARNKSWSDGEWDKYVKYKNDPTVSDLDKQKWKDNGNLYCN